MNPRDQRLHPTLTDILRNSRSPLHRLLLQADSLAHLQQRVLSCLPPEVAPHVQVAGLRERSLLIFTDSGVWATRMRHLQITILQKLNAELPNLRVQSLTIKVRPASGKSESRKRQANRLSQENSRLLQEEAAHTKDEGLKRVLESIAKHTRGSQD